MLKQGMTAIIALTLAGGSLQGCSREEVATALGALAIGAGAIAIGAASDGHDYGHDYPRCRETRHQECHDYRDYHGGHRRDCRDVYDSCDRGGGSFHRYSHFSMISELARPEMMSAETAAPADTVALANDEDFQGAWATHFAMSSDAARTLLQAFADAQKGDMQPFYRVGLADKDIKRLVKFKMITDDGIDAVAVRLDQSPEATRQMIGEIVEHAKEIQRSRD